jgi:hypothetical protein
MVEEGVNRRGSGESQRVSIYLSIYMSMCMSAVPNNQVKCRV